MGTVAFRYSAGILPACARVSAVLTLGLATGAFAQTAPGLPAGPAAAPAAQAVGPAKASDPSKEAAVVEKLITHIREEADGTGTRETLARVHVVTDAGVKQLAVLAFTYTAMNQQMDISYVRVIKHDGTVVTTPDYNIQDLPADVTREAPMYSDIHQKHVAVKGLGAGDMLEYKTTLRTLKPEVPGQFWLEYSFEKDGVILDEELDLDVPADKSVRVASADVQPTVTSANGRKLYHWRSENLSRPDPDAPPKSVKNWKPSVQVTTFTDWAQVGAWYQSLQKDQLVVTPAIKAKADALTKNLTADDDKIRAIFNAVALHTHYIGLEFGIGRYQPHAADDVLSNEYGDCKDKHTLLATLLKAEGIEAWPVLINSGHELDPAMPSPAQFDHVITVVPRDGKLVWMDSTAEVAPVGVLIGTLRDKQALAVPNSKPAYLERTPADLPFTQSARFEATGKLDENGEFTGRMSQTYHGDAELVMRSLFRAVPEAEWKEFLQRVSSRTGFGGEISSPEVSAVEKTDEPLRFAYDYKREKYSEWEDRRIGPPLPPIGWELVPGIKQTKPADDIDLGSPGEQVYKSTVQMPAGWHMFPPAGIDLTEDWAEYHSKYNFANGSYTAERRLVVKKEKIPLADWDKYLRFREAIYGDTARMSAIGAPGVEPPLPTTRFTGRVSMPSTEEMQKLMEELEPLRDAFALLGADPPSAGDLATATEKCRSTVADFETQSHDNEPSDMRTLAWAQMLGAAWTCQGWAELENHNHEVAESYLRAAWKLSQNPVAGYQLGRLLEAKGEKAAAAHTWELAYISSPGGMMASIAPGSDTTDKIAASYKKLTGKDLTATPLNRGQYNGSLRAELDRDTEIRAFVRETKLNGQGYYAVTYLADGTIRASLISGDPGMATLAPMLQGRRFPVPMPAGSKARLVREVHLICSPWGGCDAYMLLPTSVTLPMTMKVKAIQVPPPANAPNGARTLRVPSQN
ncbi:DUF3857 domain-containing transglutaminase family protein [Occallatibacter riparius]|uniref:DUF3857 and transglutaminase domain-containing protein n=1 Tax=Occallatibacter riparius TaxID=1002689 RepID=A0A9J7BSZ2_9BACT|nr:DUF3857 and transglutaminase domain-containing protein [Occallatibacter riparius]UWZ85996.1 DUF3857 and transglutaminase domain-containing protein [Occallatibacter riparius]